MTYVGDNGPHSFDFYYPTLSPDLAEWEALKKRREEEALAELRANFLRRRGYVQQQGEGATSVVLHVFCMSHSCLHCLVFV